MSEFTKEQVDKMIADAIAEKTKGLFTEDDLNKRVTSEVDRRVETGIQKGLETQRKKWEEEFSRKAQMTAEEIAQKEIEERSKELSAKEREIKRKANSLEARELLANAGVPKEHYQDLLNPLISDDDVATKTNVESFIKTYSQTKSELEAKIRAELQNVPAPQVGNGEKVIDKTAFDKMGYSEKLAFKQSNPDRYAQFMK